MIYLYPYSSVNVMITTSDSPTVSGTYTLECSVTGSTNQPTITWLDSGVKIAPSGATRMVSGTTMNPGGSYFSNLTFTPLSVSDAGMFMCRVTLGDSIQNASIAVTVEGKCNIGIHEKDHSCLSFRPTHLCQR